MAPCSGEVQSFALDDNYGNKLHLHSKIFGRPFVKRFAVCYLTVILSVLSVTLVYRGQTVGWTKIKLGMEARLGPGHTVLDGDPAPPKGHSPQFSAHVCCGQITAGWFRMPLGTEVGQASV